MTIKTIGSHISQRPKGGLRVLEIYSEEEAYETWAYRIDRSGMVCAQSAPATQEGRNVWLEFSIDGSDKTLRALAEITQVRQGKARFSFRHMWPKDEVRYLNYLARAYAA